MGVISDFFVGAQVRVLPSAGGVYSVTCPGWEGVVTNVVRESISVTSIDCEFGPYSVNPIHFECISSIIDPKDDETEAIDKFFAEF